MRTIIAAVSALMITFNSTPMSISETSDIETRIQEILNDPDCEVAVTEEGVIKIQKSDIEMLAKLVWGEARGVKSKAEQAAVIWCVLNRVEAGYGDTIKEVVTAKYQFTGYKSSHPVDDEFYELALDVLTRWELEKLGVEEVGRTLPKGYLFFTGYGGRNHFRTRKGAAEWDWSLPDPYV